MVINLNEVPEFSFNRERHISRTDRNPAAAQENQPGVTDDMVKDVFSQVDDLLGKTDLLMSEIERTANPLIPVNDDALEVRLALRSLYPGGQDNIITFQQYMASLEYLESQANVDPIKLGDMMTGHNVVDSRIISRATTAAANDDMTPEEILVIGGQFLLLAVCNRMLQTFQAPNTQSAVAGKMPPGTEVGSTLLQFLVGLAAILLQTATNEKEVKQVLSESFGDALNNMQVEPDTVIEQAKQREPDHLSKRYAQSRTEEHQAAIREYSTDYVVNSREPGYEPWIAAGDVRNIRNDLSASKNEAKNYLGTVGDIAAAPYTMSRDIYKLMLCRNMMSNTNLDQIAAVLSSKYAKDLVCCFVRFAGAIPVEELKIWRAMLVLYVNGLAVDLAKAFNVVTDHLNAHLERTMLEPVMHAVDNFFRQMSERLTKTLDPNQYSDPEAFKSILICTPVDEMFTYILSALSKVRDFLAVHITRYWSRLELKSIHGSAKIQVLADSKTGRELLKLLDAVIEAIDHGNLCATEDERTPSPEDVEEYVQRLTEDLPAAVQVPTEGGSPYQVFSDKEMNDLRSSEGFPVLRQIDSRTEHGLRDCARARINDRTTSIFNEGRNK